jgi:hypothetical protein
MNQIITFTDAAVSHIKNKLGNNGIGFRLSIK